MSPYDYESDEFPSVTASSLLPLLLHSRGGSTWSNFHKSSDIDMFSKRLRGVPLKVTTAVTKGDNGVIASDPEEVLAVYFADELRELWDEHSERIERVEFGETEFNAFRCSGDACVMGRSKEKSKSDGTSSSSSSSCTSSSPSSDAAKRFDDVINPDKLKAVFDSIRDNECLKAKGAVRGGAAYDSEDNDNDDNDEKDKKIGVEVKVMPSIDSPETWIRGGRKVRFQVVNTPFPDFIIAKREFVFEHEWFIVGKNTYFCLAKSVPDEVKPIVKKNKDRGVRAIMHFSCALIEPTAGGTRCTTMFLFDPCGRIPKWLINLSGGHFVDVVRKFKETCESSEVKNGVIAECVRVPVNGGAIDLTRKPSTLGAQAVESQARRLSTPDVGSSPQIARRNSTSSVA